MEKPSFKRDRFRDPVLFLQWAELITRTVENDGITFFQEVKNLTKWLFLFWARLGKMLWIQKPLRLTLTDIMNDQSSSFLSHPRFQ